MKKITKTSGLMFLSILLLATCNGSFMKSIKIKAKPKLRINMGSKEFTLEQWASPEKIKERLPDGEIKEKLKILDYKKSGDDTKRFLFYYPITDLDLDMNKSLESLDKISTGMDKAIAEKSFSIPKLESPPPMEFDLPDVNEKILQSFNIPPITQGSVTIPTSEFELPQVEFSLENCETVSFESGSITFNDITLPTNYQITKIVLKNKGTTEELASWNGTPTPPSLDLANKTLQKNFSLTVTITGSAGANGSVSISPSFSSDTVISKATGINLEVDPIDINKTISIYSGTAGFQDAKVETGSINLKIALPETWSGFTTKFVHNTSTDGLALQQTGENGLNLTTDASGNIELAGKTINSNDISIAGQVKLTLTDATYEKVDAPKAVITPQINLSNFAFIRVKMEDGFKTSFEQNQELNDDIKKWLHEIKFNKEFIQVELTNTLPTGNNIKIKFESSGLKTSTDASATTLSSDCEFIAGGTTGSTETKNLPDTEVFLLSDQIKTGNLPFKATVSFVDDDENLYDETTKILTIKNIDLTRAEPIKFSGKITIKPDWEYVKLKPGDNGVFKGSFPKAESFDIAKLKENLQKGYKIAGDLNARLYVHSPFFENVKKPNSNDSKYTMSSKITLSDKTLQIGSDGSLTNTDNLNIWYLQTAGDGEKFTKLEDNTNYSTSVKGSDVEFSGELPDVFTNKSETTQYTGDLPTPTKKIYLKEFLNEADNLPDSILLNYELKAQDETTSNAPASPNYGIITVTKEDLDKLGAEYQNKIKIKADLLLEVPLKISVAGTEIFTINGTSYTGALIKEIKKEEDILNRTEASKKELKEWIQMVENANLNIEYNNTMGIAVYAIIEEQTSSPNKFRKTVKIEPGAHSTKITLTGDEIEHIRSTVPFKLDIKTYIPNNAEYVVKNDAKIAVNIYLDTQMNVEKDIQIGGKK